MPYSTEKLAERRRCRASWLGWVTVVLLLGCEAFVAAGRAVGINFRLRLHVGWDIATDSILANYVTICDVNAERSRREQVKNILAWFKCTIPIVDIGVGIHQDSGLVQLGLIRPPGMNHHLTQADNRV